MADRPRDYPGTSPLRPALPSVEAMMQSGVSGRRVLVTGGTHGIGRVTTLAFARAGARVLVCHRTSGEASDSLVRELKEIGEGHHLVQADVTKRDDAVALAASCQELLGGLDVVVNNVGVDGHSAFDELPDDEWHRVMDHNVTSAYLVTQAALGLLAEGSAVVNVGASVAMRGRPGGVHYSASKAALVGFTRALCKELGPVGIRVNTVAPGMTETEPGGGMPPQVANRIVAMTPLGRLCQPEDVADAVLFLAGDHSRFISGVTLNVDGGV